MFSCPYKLTACRSFFLTVPREQTMSTTTKTTHAPAQPRQTPGPWAWLKLGSHWALFGNHGRRPVVLMAQGDELVTRGIDGRLVPIDPSHPNAAAIATAGGAALATQIDNAAHDFATLASEYRRAETHLAELNRRAISDPAISAAALTAARTGRDQLGRELDAALLGLRNAGWFKQQETPPNIPPVDWPAETPWPLDGEGRA